MVSKVVSELELIEELAVHKNEGKTIVATNGVYDLLHVGHVRSLKESKAQGNILVVGVNSDEAVKKYKGEDRPVINEKERAEMLAALSCVDYVYIMTDPHPGEWLEKIKPHVYTVSVDFTKDCMHGWYKESITKLLMKVGAKLYVLKKYEDYSSTKYYERIKKL